MTYVRFGPCHNLVKKLQFVGEKYNQYYCIDKFFEKHLPLTSHSGFPIRFLLRVLWIATWSDSVSCIGIDTQPYDKSYTVSGHVEAFSSANTLFHVYRIRIPYITYTES